jgi:hypothetical protein
MAAPTNANPSTNRFDNPAKTMFKFLLSDGVGNADAKPDSFLT